MAEEEDEMAKGQRYERRVRWRSYKALPHLFAFEAFWETVPAICVSPNSPQLKVGRYLGLRAISARIADLSPQFVMARRIFTNISANRYGSIITIVQPLLRCFLRDSVFSKLTAVSDPGTT